MTRPPSQDTNLSISLSDLCGYLVKHNFDLSPFLASSALDAVAGHEDTKLSAVARTATVAELMNRVAAHHDYRFLISGDSGAIIGIVSQLDLVKFIYKHRDLLLPHLSSEPLLKIANLGTAHCSKISEHKTVKEATQLLFLEKKQSAIAVVDDKGAMVAGFEPRCLRLISNTHRPNFDLPLREFEIIGRDPGWVVPEEKLSDVIYKLAHFGLHRIWIINDVGEPVKIVTLSDVVSYTLETLKAHLDQLINKK